MAGPFSRYFAPHAKQFSENVSQKIIQAKHICLFDGSGSMRGYNTKVGVKLLTSLLQLYPETSVSTFGYQNTRIDSRSGQDAIDFYQSMCKFDCGTYSDRISEIGRIVRDLKKTWFIITDGAFLDGHNGIEKTSTAIGKNIGVVFIISSSSYTIEPWKEVFTESLVSGNISKLLFVSPQAPTEEQFVQWMDRLRFVQDNYVPSTETQINIGQLSFLRTSTVDQLRRIIRNAPPETTQVAITFILIALESISNNSAQKLVNSQWFLTLLQALKKVPESGFEAILDKFLNDHQELTGIQAVMRKMREQLQFQEEIDGLMTTIQQNEKLYDLYQHLTTALDGSVSGLVFADKSGSFLGPLVQHLPENTESFTATVDEWMAFFRVLPTVYGMQNTLNKWYAVCLATYCITNRKLRSHMETFLELLDTITPDFINSQFFDQVTHETQDWVCAPTMAPIIFQLVKLHNIPILKKLAQMWITHRVINIMKNHEFTATEFDLENHTRYNNWGFIAVLKSHGESDPLPQYASVVYVRWSSSRQRYSCHYFENPEQDYIKDSFCCSKEVLESCIDYRYFFNNGCPTHFIRFDQWSQPIFATLQTKLREMWTVVSSHEQPECDYTQAPDYQWVIDQTTELLNTSPDVVRECPTYTFTNLDKITADVAKLTGVPVELANQVKQRYQGNLVRAGITNPDMEFNEGVVDNDTTGYLMPAFNQVIDKLESPLQIVERRPQNSSVSFDCPICLETIEEPQQFQPHDPRHMVCDDCADAWATSQTSSGMPVTCVICRHVNAGDDYDEDDDL
jgi:hypothetical protein